MRSLARLVCFGLAEIRGDLLMVRRRVPPLARRQLQRLPGHLATQHQAAMEAGATVAGRDTANIVAVRDTKFAGGRTGPVGEAGPSAHRASTGLADHRDPA